jgi:hypothetical protein
MVFPYSIFNPNKAYCAEAVTLFAAMVVQPDDDRKYLIDRTIRNLKSEGIWDELSALYVMAAHTQQAARLDWKNPGSNTLVENGSPTFTTDQGFTGGSGKYLSTGLMPDSMSNYELDDACIFSYSLTDLAENSCDVGIYDGSNQSLIFSKWSDNSYYGSINSANQSLTAVPSSIGLSSNVRNNNTQQKLYKNGVLIDTEPVASTALISVYDFWILALNNQGSPSQESSKTISCVGFGLGSIHQLKLYNIIHSYMVNK